MLVAYSAYNLIIYYLSNGISNTSFNPVSIYCIVWQVAITVYKSGLIEFYETSALTWIMIFLMELLFAFSCYFGEHIKPLKPKKYHITIFDSSLLKVKIKKWLIILTIISGAAIIINFFFLIKIYGLNVLEKINQIYHGRVSNTTTVKSIPYIGTLILVAMSFNGIYVKKYGFSWLLILDILLACIRALTMGGRAAIAFALIIFISSYKLTDFTNAKRTSLKRKAIIIFGIVLMIYAFLYISRERNAGQSLAYATERFYSLFGENIFVYKILTYIGSPIAALNEYLLECEFNFGINTFKTVYNILAKFNIIEPISQYQKWFYTPGGCNVATWIRELVEDFTISGALIANIIFGLVTGYSFKEAKKNSMQSIIVSSILFLVISFSFFDWKLRSADLWIAIIMGIFVSRRIMEDSTRNEEVQ